MFFFFIIKELKVHWYQNLEVMYYMSWRFKKQSFSQRKKTKWWKGYNGHNSSVSSKINPIS